MKYTNRATIRIFSMFLAILLMVIVMPSSTFAAIDAPMDAEESFGDPSGEYIIEPPPVAIEGGTSVESEPGKGAVNDSDISDDVNTEDSETDDSDDIGEDDIIGEDEVEEATPTSANVATEGTIGISGSVLELPPDVAEEFLAFLAAVEDIIEHPPIRPFAAPGDTGTVSWNWGQTITFTTSAGHYVGSLPILSLSTSNPSLGDPFCAYFGIDPNTSGTYRSEAGSNQQILKLLIANHEGSASDLGTQLAIWSITNHNSFLEHPQAQSAWSAAQGVSTGGYSYLEWDAGSGQPFFTLEVAPDTPSEWTLKIIKKSTTGRFLAGAEFSVSGPGVDESGLTTNSSGEILVDIPSPGGVYTVTETTPPEGYLPAAPDSQTITIDEDSPSGTVTFENEPDGEEPPEEPPEDPGTRIEVVTETETETVLRSSTEYEYSDAIGQLVIAKRDNEGASLDGAIFDIHIQFANGDEGGDSHWEVYNGSRLFAYTHPRDDHEPAVVTVTEVRPPDGYTGDSTPQTAIVHPTYTRVTKVIPALTQIATLPFRYDCSKSQSPSELPRLPTRLYGQPTQRRSRGLNL